MRARIRRLCWPDSWWAASAAWLDQLPAFPTRIERTLDFNVPTGVRPLIEIMPPKKVFDAYQGMESGDIKFWMVLTMGETGHAH